MDDAYSKTIFTGRNCPPRPSSGPSCCVGVCERLESTGDMARWEVVGVESQFGKYIKVPVEWRRWPRCCSGKSTCMLAFERDLVTGMLWVKDFKTTKSVMDEALIQMERLQGPNDTCQENTPSLLPERATCCGRASSR